MLWDVLWAHALDRHGHCHEDTPRTNTRWKIERVNLRKPRCYVLAIKQSYLKWKCSGILRICMSGMFEDMIFGCSRTLKHARISSDQDALHVRLRD